MRLVIKYLFSIIFILSAVFVLPSCKNNSKTELSSYDISIKYENGKIDGKLVYKFVNSYNTTFDHIVFNLHANAYSEGAINRPVTTTTEARAYPSGLSYGKIDIKSVRINNSPAKHEIYGEDNEFLKIFFAEIKKGSYLNVEIEFITILPESALRLGKNQTSVNLADFFPVACKVQNGKFLEISYAPVGDPFFADAHNYEVDITVPSEYVVASAGYPTQTVVDETTTTYSYTLSCGRDFAFLLSKNYGVLSKTKDEVLFTYYGFSGCEEEFLDLVIDAVNFFSKTFGKYPYKSLSVAECQLAFGGMEYSGLCFVDYSLEKDYKLKVIVHEIAHQWWHSAVGNDQNKCGYIDEGLAEYSTYLYFKTKDVNLANDIISNAKLAYKSFFSTEDTLSSKVNTTMERNLSTFKSEYEYANVAYNKSLLMFYEYGKTIGEDKAKSKLSKLFVENKFKDISLQSLIKTLGYSEHFNSFVTGKVLI